jgi:hypothetical protein
LILKPLIVGESNPFGGDEHFALYPEPPECSVMGLREETYMEAFERANLVRGKWSMRAARERASALRLDGRVHVLLGRRVCSAFGFLPGGWKPPLSVVISNQVFVLLPHPSGFNRMWGDPGLVPACREILRGVLPDIPFGELRAPREMVRIVEEQKEK